MPQNQSRKPKILLVEDEPTNRKLGVCVLGILEYEVEIATDGEEAFSKFKNDKYDLIFMDCKMPRMDGFTSTCKIREYEQNLSVQEKTPIIALTSSLIEDIESKCRACGMNGLISKPMRIEMIEAVVNKWFFLKQPGYSFICESA